MVEIIPAINAATWDEVVRRIRLVEPYAEWVHIDVADGTFTPNSLWHDPRDLAGFTTSARVEVHLMADRPEERLPEWLVEPIARLIVHRETARDPLAILAACRRRGVGLGLAVDSHTSWMELKPFAEDADLLQILAVHAGRGGQVFERHNLVKIKRLRALAPRATIEVDGGITPAIAEECVLAGADILAAGSYIFDHPSPQMAIRELRIMTND